MAKDKSKKAEPKVILEREYTVPLRRGWLKVAQHKRANRAIKELKKFLARHMKIYDRDLRKIKIEQILNNEIRFRGMRKPPAKIKVKAKKYDNDIVRVELINIPEHVKFARLRENKEKIKEKKEDKIKGKDEVKKEEKVEVKEGEVKKEKQEEAKNKEEASREEGLKISEEKAKEKKHVSKLENPKTQDMGYKRSKRGR